MAVAKHKFLGDTGYVELAAPSAAGANTLTLPAKTGTLVTLEELGVWSSYTPTISATTGAFTNASVTARYTQIGKLVTVTFSIQIIDNGTATGSILLTTPVAGTATFFHGVGRNANTAAAVLINRFNATQVYLQKLVDGTYPGANGQTITGSYTMEAA